MSEKKIRASELRNVKLKDVETRETSLETILNFIGKDDKEKGDATPSSVETVPMMKFSENEGGWAEIFKSVIDPSPAPATITLMTWDLGESSQYITQRCQALIEVVRENSVDIVALQNINDDWKEDLGNEYEIQQGFYCSEFYAQTNSIYSKHPFSSLKSVVLSPSEPAAVVGTLAFSDKTMGLACVHLKSPITESQLKTLNAEMAPAKIKIIIGDLGFKENSDVLTNAGYTTHQSNHESKIYCHHEGSSQLSGMQLVGGDIQIATNLYVGKRAAALSTLKL